MYMLSVFLFYMFVSSNGIEDVTVNIISNYVKYRNIELVTVFHCWKSVDIINLIQHLNANYVRNSCIHIDQILNNTETYKKTISSVFYEVYGYIFDINCENAQKFLELNINYNRWHSRFASIYKWLILNRDELCNTSCVERIFSNVKLRYDSDIMLINGKGISFKFYDVYNVGFNKTGGKLIINESVKYGVASGEFNKVKNIGRYELRKDLLKHTIRTVTVVTKNISIPPEEYLSSYGLKEEAMNKYHFFLYLHLQDIHNFRILLFTTNAWFGSSNMGIDGGMAKHLWFDQADFAATSGIMTPGRVLAVDFFMATYKFGSCFIFRNPTAIGRIRNQFLDPFATNIWYICLLFCVVLCICIHLTYKIHEHLGERGESSWSSSILNTWAAFCQQDIEIDGHNFTARTLVLSLMILSLLLYNYYTSSIVSDLINSRTQAFTTLGELVHSSLDLGMEEIGYVYRLFNGSTDPDVQYLRSKIMPPGGPNKFYSSEDGIALMKKGQFAYHVEPATGYPIIAKTFDAAEICDLCEIYVYQLSNIYVLCQKNSQYKKMFAISYRKMSERGIMNRQRLIWQAQKPECLSSANILQIELEQVAPAFIVLFVGVVVALIILFVERKYWKHKLNIFFRSKTQPWNIY